MPAGLVRTVESYFNSIGKNGVVNADKMDFKRASLYIIDSNGVRRNGGEIDVVTSQVDVIKTIFAAYLNEVASPREEDFIVVKNIFALLVFNF